MDGKVHSLDKCDSLEAALSCQAPSTILKLSVGENFKHLSRARSRQALHLLSLLSITSVSLKQRRQPNWPAQHSHNTPSLLCLPQFLFPWQTPSAGPQSRPVYITCRLDPVARRSTARSTGSLPAGLPGPRCRRRSGTASICRHAVTTTGTSSAVLPRITRGGAKACGESGAAVRSAANQKAWSRTSKTTTACESNF